VTKRKGQFASMIGVVVLVFILSTNIFTVIIADNNVEESFEYNSGSFNPIADAKMKADHHPEKMSRELNYSSNIVALNLGDNSGGLDWNNVPSVSSLKQNYIEQVKAEVETQNRIKNCRQPAIESLYEPDREVSWRYNNTSLSFEFEDKWVECNAQNTQARVATDQVIEVDNIRNRYIGLANYSVELAQNTPDHLPNQMTGSGSDDDEGCPETPSTERQAAIQNAKNDAKNNNLANEVFSDDSSNREGWIGLKSHSADFSFDGGAERTGSDSDGCTISCSGTGDDRECDYGPTYSYSADYEVTSTTLTFNLEDAERTVINSGGEDEAVNFEFEKTYSID